jgi:hypothetical protein
MGHPFHSGTAVDTAELLKSSDPFSLTVYLSLASGRTIMSIALAVRTITATCVSACNTESFPHHLQYVESEVLLLILLK